MQKQLIVVFSVTAVQLHQETASLSKSKGTLPFDSAN